MIFENFAFLQHPKRSHIPRRYVFFQPRFNTTYNTQDLKCLFSATIGGYWSPDIVPCEPINCRFSPPGVNSIYFLHATFLYESVLQLFCTYILALNFFGKRILAKKLLVKCWWNLLKVSTQSNIFMWWSYLI